MVQQAVSEGEAEVMSIELRGFVVVVELETGGAQHCP